MDQVPLFVRRRAKTAATFSALAQVALTELEAFGGKAEIVCGPISTGGHGTVLANLLVFNHAIEVLVESGRPVWSQVPYEAGLAALHVAWEKEHPGEYCMPIMTEFYWPLLQPHLVRRAWFLGGERGWKTSTGAQMEWDRLGKLGIERCIFREEWHYRCRLPHLT